MTEARTVLDLFDRACALHADRCALDVPGRSRLTYSELDRCARQVAAAVAPFAARDAVIAIAIPRDSPWLYASLLGVMRAGAAYVAIDPSFPPKQATAILADSGAVAVIAETSRAGEIAGAGTRVLQPDAIAREQPSAAPSAAAPHALAYVIYTSGTTGKPKGVEIEHASLLNLVAGDAREFGFGPADRMAQGSSASYDSSIEEMWLAWAVGATVVVMDDETARLGPDLLPWLVRERITVLCPPPTLLRTLACDDPARALPEMRMVYVGGEALPTDVAELWSRGCRLENGYGPTECTVTCLRTTIRPGAEVTIGRAIPGSFAAVIDPDDPALRELGDNAQGELVVGGASLARGYRGQPETTSSRFIEHATLGRVYRTGDLVHRDEHGDFHYHGRIDAQVKLRGYRIELGAIEARLAAHPSVLEAAATVEGEGPQRRLVAHVVLRAGSALDADALRAFVGEELPAYMVPAAIAAIASVPRSLAGKLDRKRLPLLARAEACEGGAQPASETERLVARAIAQTLGRDGFVGVDLDFFDDLGLDSLTVAMAISRLRGSAATKAATVRMAYRGRNVRGVARLIDEHSTQASRPAEAEAAAVGTSRPILATLAQAGFLIALLVAAVQASWIPTFGTRIAEAIDEPGLGALLLSLAAAGALAVYTVATLLLGVAAKWLLVGRYRPQRVRAWSAFHIRHWMVARLVALAPWELLGTIGLAPSVLRLLGARVGRRVHIHRGVRLTDGGWDLLTLEDDATIGQDACLRLVELDRGALVFGPITVRAGATLETRAGMSAGAELGAGSILRPLANLRAGSVHARMILDGIPATPVGAAPAPPAVAPSPFRAWHSILTAATMLLFVAVMLLPWAASLSILGLNSTDALDRLVFPGGSVLPSARGLATLAVVVVLSGILTVSLLAVLVRLLGRAPRSAYALDSFASSRMTLQSSLVEAAGKWLSGTLMWPIWLNAAGARIGKGCEISTITDVIPSTIRIGRETFFADGIYLGGPRLQAGTAVVEAVELGPSNFVGNHAVLPAGTRIAEGSLVGISTRGDGLPHKPGASWFGLPAFELPKREVVEMPRELTHDPPLLRRVNRWVWELARFALPIGPVFLGLVWFRAMEQASQAMSPLAFRVIALPLGALGVLATLALGVLVMKWLLIGRVKPGTHALWSCWCSRWDFLYVAWGMWASVPLGFLEGTLLLVGYLRAMGCRIGRRALLGHGFAHVVDPDMLRFGDDVTVDALFQAHTFEDRVLKIDYVDLRDGCTIGPNTVILYGADVGARARVAPHSVVMKREVLLADTMYEGAPTQPA
ncbi:MAG: hypothetical protein RLZZ116_1622 [Planctomycetota bacterium]|jgi:non-ribosomal peptide synthetase-like protein